MARLQGPPDDGQSDDKPDDKPPDDEQPDRHQPDRHRPDRHKPDDTRAIPVVIIDDVTVDISGTDLSSSADAELIAHFERIDAARRLLDAESASVIAQLERRGTTSRSFGHTCRTWIAMKTDCPTRQASRDLRVARLLDAFPTFAEALRDGRLSVHHIDAIARETNDRNAEAVAAIQEQLIALAVHYLRIEPFERRVRDLLRAADADGGHQPLPEHNRLTITDALDGEIHLRGRFVGHWARTIKDTLDALTDREFHRFKADNEATNGEMGVPARSTLAALALVEACRQGRSATNGSGPAADATLVVHSDDPEHPRTVNGDPIDSHTRDLLCCDPVIHPVVIDSLGVPTHLGRSVRWVTAAQRRALAVRDGGCVFPGCLAPPNWTDAHHVIPWYRGGPTDLPNLASLCRHHHGVVHRTGWSLEHLGDGRFRFTTPTNQILSSQRHHAKLEQTE